MTPAPDASAAPAARRDPVVPAGVALSPWLRRLCRLCGVPPAQLEPLRLALARDAARQRQARAGRASLAAQAFTTLIAMYLGFTGLGLAVATFAQRAAPERAAAALLTVQGAFVTAFALSELFPLLLSDDDFRVIAAWPVAPASYLLAKLLPPAQRMLGATLLLCGPSCLVLALAGGTPLVTGALLLLVALVGAVLIVGYVAALYALLVRLVGAPRLRLLALMAQLGVALIPVAGVALGNGRAGALATPPAGLPSRWGAALVALSTRQRDGHELALAGAALALLLLAPLVFRLAARGYGRGLATARVHSGRSWLLAPLAAVARRVRRPADRAVALLFLAHARHDWRFRLQLALSPMLATALVLAALRGLPVARLFADPFAPVELPHPAMLFVVLALLPPLLAVPMVSASSDAGAAWIVRSGVVPAPALLAATRRLVRVVLQLPLWLVMTAGYLWTRTPPLHLLAQLATLALIGEVTLLAMQAWLPLPPFSSPRDDRTVADRMAAAVMLAYVLAGIVAAVVVHVFYRNGLAWAALFVWLLYLRRQLDRRVTVAAARRAADREADILRWSPATSAESG